MKSLNELKPVMGAVRKWTILREKYQLGDSNNYESVQVAAGLAIGRNEKVEVLEAAPTLQLIDKLEAALKFYTLKSSYSIVDEGRNYSVDYKCYELNEDTYADEELGTKAHQALTELRKWKDGLK